MTRTWFGLPASPGALLGGLLIGVLLLAAGLGMVWTPYDPLAIDFRARLQPPGPEHWLGTDEFGRDVFSRALAGASTSVSISLFTVAAATVAGMLIGLAAGYLRGWTDRIVVSITDALLAFPGILLALGLLAVLGANKYGIILALALAYTPSVVRVVRSNVFSLRETGFVEASRVMGNGELFTMARHVLPNCIAPVTVLATGMFGWVLLSESALSFLGLGVPPPAPTWGNMLAASRPYMSQAPWLGIYPGLCIALTLLGINLLGDAVRDRLDPRMRRI
jgi:peptide/nickel transport system permease protein